ncbi:MAG: hypothetical protein IJJ23_10220 [Clostridia bacterium]|nr:hypothetical protein [Clostridia bacterium]
MERTLQDWQNPNCLHVGRENPRATLIPYPDAQTALIGDKALSDAYKLLNGTWDFYYAPTGIAPEHFQDVDYDGLDDGWETIPVPGNWQMHGYDAPPVHERGLSDSL